MSQPGPFHSPSPPPPPSPLEKMLTQMTKDELRALEGRLCAQAEPLEMKALAEILTATKDAQSRKFDAGSMRLEDLLKGAHQYWAQARELRGQVGSVKKVLRSR